jgi:hypothetical protein
LPATSEAVRIVGNVSVGVHFHEQCADDRGGFIRRAAQSLQNALAQAGSRLHAPGQNIFNRMADSPLLISPQI